MPTDPPSGRSRSARWFVPLVAIALAVTGGTACTGSPEPGPTTPRLKLAWQGVTLPDGAEPESLAGAGNTVVVGGRSDGAPRMFVLRDDLAVRRVDLVGHGVYAATATWVDLAIDGPQVLALGRASGGAHGLPRWTVWSGSTQRVEEQPQPFETFGGPRSGGLAGVALGSGRALVVGSWDDGGAGLDAAVWGVSGTSWGRTGMTSGALASTATRLVQPAAAAVTSTGVYLVGSTTDLGGDDVVLGASAWTAPHPEGPWTRVDLPATTTSSRATGLSCDSTGCWVVGLDGDAVALWRLDPDRAARVTLPRDASSSPGRVAAVAAVSGQVWVATSVQDGSQLLRRDAEGSWTVFDGPTANRPESPCGDTGSASSA
ncbi:hypothetical protein [Pedococcus bigeumensis]|uniref:Uncharacterized protein n=1 Tax=Pedococcus bigeumensis TaxID=433644 RepID=A0A502CUH2_9MICO|nr:hypothetical protein [Pedococcus bigeumensis]TPG16887.1 hypothetical protein EAH86_08825 [Pedococcus bigeumensis]